MSVGSSNRGGVTGAVRIDLRRLHESWMELLFPRQRGTGHSVLGKWTPNTTSGWIAYRLWSALGVPFVAVLYPLALFGFMARFYSRRIDRVAAGLVDATSIPGRKRRLLAPLPAVTLLRARSDG